jgi:hypothetical protein
MAVTDFNSVNKNDKARSVRTGGFRYKKKCKKNALVEISVRNNEVPGLLKV